jgi:hypothetical protein
LAEHTQIGHTDPRPSVATSRHLALSPEMPQKRVEVLASVVVGEEHAAILTEKLGYPVKAGDVFDLGLVAGYDPDPILNEEIQAQVNQHHIFNDPVDER